MANNGESPGRARLWVLGIGTLIAVWLVPLLLYPDQIDARAALQSGMLTMGAAILAVAGGLEALTETRRANAEARRANENTHVRELYTRAVDQLGSDTATIRFGGIYALQRIANDSPADQRIVVEVLSAFVRDRSTDPALRSSLVRDDASSDDRVAADLRAAVQVLARLPRRPRVPRADLAGANLTDAAGLAGLDLTNADLSGTRLDGADLSGTRLDGADLSGTRLDRANLSGARMMSVNLHRANLIGADLSDARLETSLLIGTRLTRANLSRTSLVGATLLNAWLDQAMLTDADLSGATLARPNYPWAKRMVIRGGFGAGRVGHWLNMKTLTPVDLDKAASDARGLTQEQVDAAEGDGRTKLPEGLNQPVSWTGPS